MPTTTERRLPEGSTSLAEVAGHEPPAIPIYQPKPESLALLVQDLGQQDGFFLTKFLRFGTLIVLAPAKIKHGRDEVNVYHKDMLNQILRGADEEMKRLIHELEFEAEDQATDAGFCDLILHNGRVSVLTVSGKSDLFQRANTEGRIETVTIVQQQAGSDIRVNGA